MRTSDFEPLYRSTIGFDRLFDMLDATSTSNRPDWPPYNIERKSENEYRITMALAGFRPEEIELTQQGNNLLVVGQKQAEQQEWQMLHRGIAARQFKQTFKLADYVKVVAANLENGLLSVDLMREVPEQLKPRRINISRPIDGTSAASPDQDNRPKQVTEEPAEQSNAA